MRIPAAVLLLSICLSRSSFADAPPSPEVQFQHQKKSVVLAVTLEVLCPIAGAGAFYAGEGDRATALAVLSTISAGATVGSVFYLIHLSHQSPSGASGVVHDLESVSAWTGLVVGGAVYLLTRASGLSLAPDAVTSFNADLQQRLGLPQNGPQVPFRAQATGLSLMWRF